MTTNGTSSIPEHWSDSEVLDGLDLLDKAEILGVPFRITAVYFDENSRGVSYVYVDAERADGTTFSFNDSSTGVRAQLVALLSRRGLDSAVDTGAVVPLNLVIPKGLRVSPFTVRDETTGKMKEARTYYLTTSGKRAVSPPVHEESPFPEGSTPAAKTRKTTARTAAQ